MTRILFVFSLVALVVVGTHVSSAQKKKVPEAPVGQTSTPKAASLFHDFLAQHQGVETNHGILTKVGGDYVVFEDDGVPTIVPLSCIQSVKITKEKEDEEKPEKTKLVIKLVSGE